MTAVQSRMRDPGLTAAPSVDHATVRVTFEYVTWAQGFPGVFPPLKGSAVVTSPDPTEHIRTVRTSWGNHAPPVKPEDVVARR